MNTAFLLALLSGGLWAALPPPSYEEELVSRVAESAERLNHAGRFQEGNQLCQDFQERFGWNVDLLYEQGFALNALQQDAAARRVYQQAVELDPTHAAAWYDLGELELRADRLDEASIAFQHALALRPDHWAGAFRLADVAARRGDSALFEDYLKSSLRGGFSFKFVVVDPHWRDYYREPALGEVIRRLITVYGDEALIDAFEQPIADE